MFVVNGTTRQGLTYRVAVGPEVRREPGALGQVMGPAPVMALMMLNQGLSIRVTPTGPSVTLDLEDPESILGALYALTTVLSVEGDAPEVIPQAEEGVTY
jgi:hypothetical protein